MPRDGYADKIAKLLAMAEDPSVTESEAANFLAKASELRMNQMISDDEIRRAGTASTPDDTIAWRFVMREKSGFVIKARRELLYGLCDIHNVRTAIASDRSYIKLFGHTTDMDFVEQMLASLTIQMRGHMESAWRDAIGADAGARTWKTSFAHGYVGRVIVRLRAIQAAKITDVRETSAPGVELVLRDRNVAVQKYYDDYFGGRKLRGSYKNTSVRSADGVVAGYRAGADADLGQTRVGGSRVQLTRGT